MNNLESIDKATQLKKELDALRPLSAENELRVIQKFRLDWNYHSNNIEGNSLNFGETKALILFGITAQGKPLRDHLEVKGHNQAIQLILDIVNSSRPLTENPIREIHILILKEPYEVDAISPNGVPLKKRVEIGVYKKTPNHVLTATKEIFRFASPEETPALMHDLIEWYREHLGKEDLHPVLLASSFHYKFIRIHPFDDGNGRTARILMNFILMCFGYPPAIIRTEDKQNYFAALRQADAGNPKSFIDYIAKSSIDSLQLMIRAAKGLRIEEPDDIDKEVTLLEQDIQRLGDPIERTMSQANILAIFDNSGIALIDRFIEKCQLLSKFYLTSKFHLMINGVSVDASYESQISSVKSKIADNTNIISMKYGYSTFNRPSLKGFSFSSQIDLKFNTLGYTVTYSSTKDELEKAYGEQLTEDEITNLVGTEIRNHKKQIELKMNDLKGKI